MTPAELAAKIIADCTRLEPSEGLTLAKLQAATEILNSAKPPPKIWTGCEWVKCPPVDRKVRWRLFPQFRI